MVATTLKLTLSNDHPARKPSSTQSLSAILINERHRPGGGETILSPMAISVLYGD